MHHSADLRHCLEDELSTAGLGESVEVDWQSCFGRCSQGPNTLVRELAATEPKDERPRLAALPVRRKGRAALYSGLAEADMIEIVKEHLVGGRVIRRLLCKKPTSAQSDPSKPREHRLPQVLSTVRGRSEGE